MLKIGSKVCLIKTGEVLKITNLYYDGMIDLIKCSNGDGVHYDRIEILELESIPVDIGFYLPNIMLWVTYIGLCLISFTIFRMISEIQDIRSGIIFLCGVLYAISCDAISRYIKDRNIFKRLDQRSK